MIVSAVINVVIFGTFIATLAGATALLGWVLLVALPMWLRLIAQPLMERRRQLQQPALQPRRPVRNSVHRSPRRPHLVADAWADVDLWADVAWLYRASAISQGA
jgi:hypothetical protein